MTKPIELTVADRRKSPRRAVSQVVRLELESGVPASHPCLLVTDISDGGARLFAQGIEIPKTFAVVFSESGIRRECRVVWQIGPEVGLEFVDQPSERRTRSRARQSVLAR